MRSLVTRKIVVLANGIYRLVFCSLYMMGIFIMCHMIRFRNHIIISGKIEYYQLKE